jgi:hypothetical protein
VVNWSVSQIKLHIASAKNDLERVLWQERLIEVTRRDRPAAAKKAGLNAAAEALRSALRNR